MPVGPIKIAPLETEKGDVKGDGTQIQDNTIGVSMDLLTQGKIEAELSPKTVANETKESFQALNMSPPRYSPWPVCCHGSDKPPKLNDGSIGTTIKYLVKAHNQYKGITVLITFAVIFDVWAVEERWANGNKSCTRVEIIKMFGSVMTLLSLILLIRYYHFINMYHLSKSGFEVRQTNYFYNSELRTWFYLEFLFLLIHSVPFLDGGMYVEEHATHIKYHFSYDELLGSFQVFRILIWLRGFHVWKGLATNMKNATFASIKKLEFDAWFTLRQQLYLKPMSTLLFILVNGTILGGYVLMVCERPNSAEFAWFSNAMWVVLVTMTTVGYGDLYPSSTLGRIICIMACLLGNFLFGLLVTSQANLIELSHPEKQATESLELMGHTKRDSRDAAAVVVAALNYKYFLRKFQLLDANDVARRKVPKVREAHDTLIEVLKTRRRRHQNFKRNKRRDESTQVLQTLKLQTHLVMDLNRNVRDLGLVVANLKKQLDATNERMGIKSPIMDEIEGEDAMFMARDLSNTSDAERELRERNPITPTVQRDEVGFFAHMDSASLK